MTESELKSQGALPTVALPAIEVFAVGRWNGDAYSAQDLDAIVSAFAELRDSWEPVAKAGHEDGQQNHGETKRLFGAPALGYVERLYRSGEKLIADFKDVPRRFAQLIKAGTYKKISSEIYWNYKNPANGKVYPRVLRAVAFLGAEIPAVTNLKEIEALFSVSENGALYAYDEDENEYRAYELKEYACTVKQDPNGKYCVYDGDGQKVGEYDNEADAQDACDSMNDDETSESQPDDETAEAKKQSNESIWVTLSQMEQICPSCAESMRRKRYSKVKISDAAKLYAGFSQGLCDRFGQGAGFRTRCMKALGDSEDKISDPGAFCNKLKEYCFGDVTAGDTKKQSQKKLGSQNYAGGTDMTEEEVNALMKKREDELSAKIYKEMEDRVHKAREEGKEDANKENELLREDIRKLQLEKRSERIEHWIKGMKEAGKILPSEESKIRSLRTWLPDDGAELKYFAVKEGQTKEFSSGPAEMFESLFKDRKSVFTNYSHADDSPEDEGQEMQDPSAEVDRRAKAYQDKMSKESKTVSYKDALSYVLRTNAGLAQRYQDRSRPN